MGVASVDGRRVALSSFEMCIYFFKCELAQNLQHECHTSGNQKLAERHEPIVSKVDRGIYDGLIGSRAAFAYNPNINKVVN